MVHQIYTIAYNYFITYIVFESSLFFNEAYICSMQRLSLFAMSMFYVGTGVNHFLHSELYLRIMPPWLLWHNELVVISGVCEVSFGLLLLFSSTRRVAAWCIIFLLIAVFPANIQMMLNYWNESNLKLWISIIRLPLQIILILWAYSFTKHNIILKTQRGNDKIVPNVRI